jgi:hypothetical protein
VKHIRREVAVVQAYNGGSRGDSFCVRFRQWRPGFLWGGAWTAWCEIKLGGTWLTKEEAGVIAAQVLLHGAVPDGCGHWLPIADAMSSEDV